MKAIRLDVIGLYQSGDKRHPQQVISDLGIKYETCEPVTIADCWIFYKVSNVPNKLPKALELIDIYDDNIDVKPWHKDINSSRVNIKGKLLKIMIGDQEIVCDNDFAINN